MQRLTTPGPTIWGLIALILAGCSSPTAPAGCEINGPLELMPQQIQAIRTGISRAELEALLGAADYSPADGILYFSTGGDCPLDDERLASCGLVAEFRRESADDSLRLVDALQSCRWGAIGE